MKLLLSKLAQNFTVFNIREIYFEQTFTVFIILAILLLAILIILVLKCA